MAMAMPMVPFANDLMSTRTAEQMIRHWRWDEEQCGWCDDRLHGDATGRRAVSYSAAPSSGDPARTWATPAATRPVALRYFLDRPEYWVFYSPFVALANHFRGRPRGANRAADGEHTFAEERRLIDEHAATARRHCRSRELAWWLCAFQCPATSGQGAGAAAARMRSSREPEQARTGSTAHRSARTTTAGSEALRARGQSQGERTPEGGA